MDASNCLLQTVSMASRIIPRLMGIKEAFRGRAENNANVEVPETDASVLSCMPTLFDPVSKLSPFRSCARRLLSEKVKDDGWLDRKVGLCKRPCRKKRKKVDR